MGVYIKGMRMPENCRECQFSDHEAWCLIPGNWRERYYCPDDYVSEHCPLVDLGKHGRLIDADKLKTEFPKDTDWEYPVNTNEYVCEMIDNAETVIEAEENK